jgi:hypothetical protein
MQNTAGIQGTNISVMKFDFFGLPSLIQIQIVTRLKHFKNTF